MSLEQNWDEHWQGRIDTVHLLRGLSLVDGKLLVEPGSPFESIADGGGWFMVQVLSPTKAKKHIQAVLAIALTEAGRLVEKVPTALITEALWIDAPPLPPPLGIIREVAAILAMMEEDTVLTGRLCLSGNPMGALEALHVKKAELLHLHRSKLAALDREGRSLRRLSGMRNGPIVRDVAKNQLPEMLKARAAVWNKYEKEGKALDKEEQEILSQIESSMEIDALYKNTYFGRWKIA